MTDGKMSVTLPSSPFACCHIPELVGILDLHVLKFFLKR
jgi:hypothetical protein